MGDKVCIICEKPVSGLKAVKVKEDAILGFIRSVKRATKTAQENELYVCEADLPKYNQRRNEFQKSIIIATILAALVVVAVAIGAIMSGTINVVAIVAAIFIAGIIFLFSVIIKYVPAVESNEPKLIPPKIESTGKEETKVEEETAEKEQSEEKEKTAEKEEQNMEQSKAEVKKTEVKKTEVKKTGKTEKIEIKQKSNKVKK